MDYITFSTKKTIAPNRGFVGLNPEGQISEGFDGQYILEGDDSYGEYDSTNSYQEQLSLQEQIELADIMVLRWLKFRDSVIKRRLNP